MCDEGNPFADFDENLCAPPLVREPPEPETISPRLVGRASSSRSSDQAVLEAAILAAIGTKSKPRSASLTSAGVIESYPQKTTKLAKQERKAAEKRTKLQAKLSVRGHARSQSATGHVRSLSNESTYDPNAVDPFTPVRTTIQPWKGTASNKLANPYVAADDRVPELGPAPETVMDNVRRARSYANRLQISPRGAGPFGRFVGTESKSPAECAPDHLTEEVAATPDIVWQRSVSDLHEAGVQAQRVAARTGNDALQLGRTAKRLVEAAQAVDLLSSEDCVGSEVATTVRDQVRRVLAARSVSSDARSTVAGSESSGSSSERPIRTGALHRAHSHEEPVSLDRQRRKRRARDEKPRRREPESEPGTRALTAVRALAVEQARELTLARQVEAFEEAERAEKEAKRVRTEMAIATAIGPGLFPCESAPTDSDSNPSSDSESEVADPDSDTAGPTARQPLTRATAVKSARQVRRARTRQTWLDASAWAQDATRGLVEALRDVAGSEATALVRRLLADLMQTQATTHAQMQEQREAFFSTVEHERTLNAELRRENALLRDQMALMRADFARQTRPLVEKVVLALNQRMTEFVREERAARLAQELEGRRQLRAMSRTESPPDMANLVRLALLDDQMDAGSNSSTSSRFGSLSSVCGSDARAEALTLEFERESNRQAALAVSAIVGRSRPNWENLPGAEICYPFSGGHPHR